MTNEQHDSKGKTPIFKKRMKQLFCITQNWKVDYKWEQIVWSYQAIGATPADGKTPWSSQRTQHRPRRVASESPVNGLLQGVDVYLVIPPLCHRNKALIKCVNVPTLCLYWLIFSYWFILHMQITINCWYQSKFETSTVICHRKWW